MYTLRYIWGQYASPLMLLLLLVAVVVGVAVGVGLPVCGRGEEKRRCRAGRILWGGCFGCGWWG